MSNRSQFVRHNAANFVTFLNVVCGAISILFSLNGQYRWAIAFIFLASVADRYDGTIARRLGTSSDLGVQLDSLGDSVSFGVAPALLVYLSLFRPLPNGPIRIALSACVVIYISCGIFRLARYNVCGLDEGAFEGVPITLAGTFLSALLLFARELHPFVYGALLLLLGLLMVSKIRFRKR